MQNVALGWQLVLAPNRLQSLLPIWAATLWLTAAGPWWPCAWAGLFVMCPARLQTIHGSRLPAPLEQASICPVGAGLTRS